LAKEVAEAHRQRDELRSQNERLKNVSMLQQSDAQNQVHSVMLRAAEKVHEMEEKVDSVEAELQQTKSSLTAATDEASKAKDTLVQETDAALKASQRADALSASLATVQSAAEQSRAQTSSLLEKVHALQDESTRATSALQKSSEQASQWEAKAESLQRSLTKASKQAQQFKDENNNLQLQVEELMREHQRAEELSNKLSTLQVAARANSSREEQLAQQVERLRDLKDHYSSQYDAARHESEASQGKAEKLEQDLLAAERSETAVARQRDAALDRVRSARSEEDEYFEENTHLQQGVEELQTQLHDAYAASNHSAANEEVLRGEVQGLRGDIAQEKQTAHAAWVANERELIQARRDLRSNRQAKETLQAEVSRLQSVLTDNQRQTLSGERAPSEEPTSVPTRLAAVSRAHRLRAIRGSASLRQKSAVGTVGRSAHAAPAAPAAHAVHAAHAAHSAAAAAASTRSTLQKLAEYFASPIQQ